MNSVSIVLSINPWPSMNIRSGCKTEELRTRKLPYKDHTAVRAFIYETSPTKKIVGEFWTHSSKRVFVDKPLRETLAALCIDEWQYVRYLKNKGHGFSHEIYGVIDYDRSYELSDFGLTRAPYSWLYAVRIPEELRECPGGSADVLL